MFNAGATTKQDVEIVSRPTDDGGAAARVETFRVESSDASVVSGVESVSAAEDGSYTARCVVNGVGRATLTVVADADLGEGVENITDEIDVTVSNPKATNLGLTVTAVPKS